MAETAEQYNAKVIDEFRANGGRVGGMWGETPLLLLHHTGAKFWSGPRQPGRLPARWAVLLHLGRERRSAEEPSLVPQPKSHPSTRIEVGGETIEVVAEETTGDERDRLFATAAERYPQLAEVARKTTASSRSWSSHPDRAR